MSNTQMFITIGSVFLGFFLFTCSFVAFMYKKPPRLTWSLLVTSIVFITVVPVTIAVFWATLFVG